MMKNVLVICGSARKGGNSELLADAFVEGAIEAGHTVEKVRIAPLDIRGCVGCDACHRNGGTCVQKDDMRELYPKVDEADAIALAFPVYFYTWNAQMKAFLDRLYAFEPKLLHDKDFYLLASCAGDEERYLEHLRAAFELYVGCFPQNNRCAGHAFAMATMKRGDAKGNPGLDDARELGRTI